MVWHRSTKPFERKLTSASLLSVRLEDLGLVGNCQFSALIERSGSVVWCCLPRFDSDPVFATLLDEEDGGHFTIAPADGGHGTQRYLENTNVLETRFETESGAFRVLDFAPRFHAVRAHVPADAARCASSSRSSGTPRIRVRVRSAARLVEGRAAARHRARTTSTIAGFGSRLRLTTDVPLSYLGGRAVRADRAPALRAHLGRAGRRAARAAVRALPAARPCATGSAGSSTATSRRCISSEVIRSALALKLHCFEDTGAIVAAMTTSIPEAPGSGRTWDYRYCWLRDAYYALGAFRLLGHFEEREEFMQLPAQHRRRRAATWSSRRCTASTAAPTWKSAMLDELARLRRRRPGARRQRRGRRTRSTTSSARWCWRWRRCSSTSASTPSARKATLDLLERLARKAIAVAGTPDAGIWEYRTEWQPQTFSSLMCWAAADRMAHVAALHRAAASSDASATPPRASARRSCRKAWNPRARQLRRQLRRPRSRRVAAADGAAAPAADGRSARCSARSTRSGKGLVARRLAVPLPARRRLRPAHGRVHLCTFWLVEALARPAATPTPRRVMEQRPHGAVAARAALGGLRDRRRCACGATSRRPTRTSG